MYAFDKWYKCLNSRERNMILLCLPFFIVTDSFIERTTWEAFAAVVGLSATNKLVANWLIDFHMYYDVIIIPDEPPLPVVKFEFDFWLQLSAWLAINGTGAPPMCEFVIGFP